MTTTRNISLQWRFILITSAAIVIFTASLGFLAVSRNRDVLYEATEKQGKVLAQTVAAMIINELIYEKLGLVEEGGLIDNYLQELFKRREFDYLYLAVLNEEGRVISHSDFREYGKIYKDNNIRFEDNSVLVSKTSAVDGKAALKFAAPLSIGGKNWGTFLFAVTLDHVNAQIRRMLIDIWSIALIALFAGFFMIYFLSRRFIQPITLLAAVMQEVDVDQPPQKVLVSGCDELSQLAESFNTMITRLSQANDEMKQAHDKLLQSEKLATLGILSSSMAHRINNPLGGLQNCLAMLKKRGDDPEFRNNYLELMQESVESIEQTVSQLLWSAGKRRGEKARANISNVLGAVMRFVDYRVKKNGIIYTAEVPDDIVVSVTPHDLNQILTNLLVNATQAMPKGGTLSVSAIKSDVEVVITISDTGIGIAPKDIDTIFDLFYSTKTPEEGTGLGLWMTYELVKKNNGEITVSSESGAGTIFTIQFLANGEETR